MITWDSILQSQQNCDYYQALQAFVENERAQGKVIYPPESQVFSALGYTPFEQVKVVILGQDPYHGEGQAHGLAFSVGKDIAIPPSLRNMYKALAIEYPNFETPNHGYLKGWADQGVLLLNAVLTVEQGQAHSHAKAGWETLTDHFIEQLNQHKQGLVFLLWGAHAQKKGQMIDTQKHLVLTAPHPSPLSAHRGFFTCGHFSQTNAYLKQNNQTEIDWSTLPA